uniref:WD40 repeat domain-containing protein n=1 Tax=Oscillatoriales cyanobacterium SpSt-418 TaxID=2282169 RepID=A0A7C3PKJ0_9CYAN
MEYRRYLLLLLIVLNHFTYGCQQLSARQTASFSPSKKLVLEEISPSADFASIALSPDSKRITVTGLGEPLQLWDVATGKKVHTFRLGTYSSLSTPVAFSPDGKILASGEANGKVGLWNPENGQKLRMLTGHHKPVTSIVFSKDGKLLASGGSDGSIRIWETHSGKVQKVVNLLDEVVEVAFGLDNQLLISSKQYGNVLFWNRGVGGIQDWFTKTQPVKKDDEPFYISSFSPDGRFVARGSKVEGSMQIIDLRTQAIKQVLQGQYGASSVFSPNNAFLATVSTSQQRGLITGGNFHELRIWDLQTGRLLAKSSGREYITVLTFSGNSKTLVTGGAEGELLFWDISKLSCTGQ